MSDDYSGTYDSGSYDAPTSSPEPTPSYEPPQPIDTPREFGEPGIDYPAEDAGLAPTEAEISFMSDQAVYILLTTYLMEAGRPAPYRDSRAQNRAALRRLASERRHHR